MLKFDQQRWKASPCLEGGVPYYLLVEQRSGQRIRLFEIEFKLLQYFDGTRPLSEVRNAFREEFKITIGVDESKVFVQRLVQRELLSGVDEEPSLRDGTTRSASNQKTLKDTLTPLLPFIFGGLLAAAGLEFYRTFTTYSVAILPVTEMSIPRFSPVRARSDLPMRSGRLSFAEPGVVEDILVKRGDRVSSGQVMAQLRLPKRVAKRVADIRVTKREYKDMLGRLGAELGEERRFIERLRERIEVLKENALRVPEQGEENPALRQLAEEQALLLEKKQTFSRLENSFEQLLIKLKTIEQMREGLLKENRDKFILAPFDAVVEEAYCEEGQRVKGAAPCFSIVDQRNRIVEYRLREKPDLYVGARVQLLKGDRWISGTLDEITQVYQQFLVRVRYKDEVKAQEKRFAEESARLLERWIDDAAAIPRSAMWDSTRSETVGYVLMLRGEEEAEVKRVDVVKRDARWVWIRIGQLDEDGSGLAVVHDLTDISETAPPVGRTFPISVTKRLDERFSRREWNPKSD